MSNICLTKVNLSTRKLSADSISKESRLYITHFERYLEVPFDTLSFMLSKNYMFSPFAFEGHKRGVDTLCSEANLLVLDVDHTDISIQDKFTELVDENLNVIIATTSDSANMYKYRILLPLDRPISALEYRRLVFGVRDLGLVTDLDLVAVSQIYYAYQGSKVLSSFSGVPLPVEDYMVDPHTVREYTITDVSATELPSDFAIEFRHFLRPYTGSRSKRLSHAAYLMTEQGYNKTQVTKGVLAINKYFLVPKSTSEIQRRVLGPILKGLK